MFIRVHMGMHMHACVSVCMICRDKGEQRSAGLVEGESQRSGVFASQEKMKFKVKTTALGDSEPHLYSVNLTQ